MSTNFYILAQIEDFNGVDFGEPGQPESPLLQVVQRALESTGGQFNNGEVAPAPRVWPPFVAVVAETTPISDEMLKESIEEAWGTVVTDNEPLPPLLQVYVDAQD